MDAENGPVLADVGVSFVASGTGPTGQVTFDGDMVPHRVALDTGAKGSDGATGLMAGHRAKRNILSAPVIPFPNVQICPANGG